MRCVFFSDWHSRPFFYYIGIHVLEKFGKENLVGLDWFAVVNWLYFPRVWIELVLHYITDGKLTLPQSSELLCHPEKGLNKQLTIFVKNINLFKVQGKKSLLLVSKLWQKKYETKAVFELISVWVLSCFWIILRNVLLQEPLRTVFWEYKFWKITEVASIIHCQMFFSRLDYKCEYLPRRNKNLGNILCKFV